VLRSCGLVLGFVFTVFLPFPYFILSTPLTILRTLRGLLGWPITLSRDEFVSFNALDLAPRCWYRKIARDQANLGWLGFVWDDGFGIPLRSRFHNNWLTYAPLHRLGCPLCLGLGYLLAATGMFILFDLGGKPYWGIVAACTVLGSPLFIASQVFYGKPETCWWFPAPLLVYFILQKSWLVAGFIWSAISLINLPAATVLGLSSGLGFLFFDREVCRLWPSILGFLPGGLFILVRLAIAWLDGFTRRMGRAQREAQQAKGSHLPPVFLLSAAYLLLPLFLALGGKGIGYFIFSLVPLVLYWAILFVYYFNDPAPIVALMFACEAGFVAEFHDTCLAVAALLFAFVSPLAFPYTLAEFREDVPQGARGLGALFDRYVTLKWLKDTWRKYRSYPSFTSVRFDETKPLLALFESVPQCTRVVLETDPRGSKALGFRGLVNYLDCFLPLRRIEIVPDEYLLQFHSHLTGQLHLLFGEADYSKQSLEVARTMGARYMLVFSERMLGRLKADGSEVVGVLDCSGDASPYRALTDRQRLSLVRLPITTGLVEPPPEHLQIQGNRLIWQARKGISYQIRYAHHPNFRARSLATGQSTPVRPYWPAELSGVAFMEVLSPADGDIELRFRESMF